MKVYVEPRNADSYLGRIKLDNESKDATLMADHSKRLAIFSNLQLLGFLSRFYIHDWMFDPYRTS